MNNVDLVSICNGNGVWLDFNIAPTEKIKGKA